MSRIYRMLQEVERPLFLYVNIRWNRSALNWLFHILSLLAGATFSLCHLACCRIIRAGAMEPCWLAGFRRRRIKPYSGCYRQEKRAAPSSLSGIPADQYKP